MCPIACGDCSYASSAVAGALYLPFPRGDSGPSVGFRSDSTPSPHRHLCHSGVQGDIFRRAARATAKSVCFHDSGRAACGFEGFVS